MDKIDDTMYVAPAKKKKKAAKKKGKAAKTSSKKASEPTTEFLPFKASFMQQNIDKLHLENGSVVDVLKCLYN